MFKPMLITTFILAVSMTHPASAASADCASLKLTRMDPAPLNGFGGLMVTASNPGSMISSASPSSAYTCNNTTIQNTNGQVRITGKTFADAVKQANRLQPYLYRAGGDSSRAIKIVFSTNNVAANAARYPLSYEAVGFSLDRGETIKPLVLEGRVYPPLRFSANDVAGVFTDDASGLWSEAWLNPRERTVIFKP